MSAKPEVVQPSTDDQRHVPADSKGGFALGQPSATKLSAFFKESDSSLGVFYPKHYIIATFPTLEATRAANQALRNAGVSEDEVMAVTGADVLEFFKQFREHTGILGALMSSLSRFFGTEAKFVDSDIDDARHGAGFVAIHSLTDSESARVVEVVRPLEPMTMQWYLAGGIRSLI